MAREKNTARSAARRRTRAAARDARTSAFAAEDDELGGTALGEEPVTDEAPARPSFLKIPNIGEDIRLLPQMFATRRLLWLPFLMLIAGFIVVTFLPSIDRASTVGQLVDTYVAVFFDPRGLLTFLLGGFLAPRASYLVGLLLGLVNAALLLAYAAIRSQDVLVPGTDPTAAQAAIALLVGYALIVGPLGAAFASWYRSFLNRMGANSRERRLARDAERARKQKEELRAARRAQRPKGSA